VDALLRCVVASSAALSGRGTLVLLEVGLGGIALTRRRTA